MSVRQPLKNDSGNLKEMSSAEVSSIVDQIVYQYSLSPSVQLTVVGSGGNLGSISDTRLQAGAMSSDASAFPDESATAEPSVVTVTSSKINQTIHSASPTADTGKTFPVYRNSNNQIQAMSLQDVKDTFLHPAIDLITSSGLTYQQAGTYHISTASSISGSTLISSTPVFVDTRADTSAFTAGEIGETLDQPTNITSYYLQRKDGSDVSYINPMFVNAQNNIQEFAPNNFKSLLQAWVQQTAGASTDGYKITYSLGTTGTGTTKGSGMSDTRLNGSGNYQQRYVNTDDYRAQEFPDGTPTSINTYYLRINKS